MNQNPYKVALALLFALSSAFFTAGCNTIEGLGEDTAAAGEAVDEEAEEEAAD